MNLSSSQPKRQYRMSARAESTTATGERLLDAAWRHFATRPYEQVRLQEIAKEAGVSAQTLHTRFGSKEDLLGAAYVWFGQQEIANRPAKPAEDPASAVRLIFDRYEQHGQAILRMLSQEERIPAVRQMTDAGRAYHRHWARTTFATLLQDLRGERHERELTKMVIATDLLVWKLLRLDMKLARKKAEAVVLEMLRPTDSTSRKS